MERSHSYFSRFGAKLALFATLSSLLVLPTQASSGLVSITMSGPSASTLSIDTEEAVIMDFVISATSDVTFHNLPISLSTAAVYSGSGPDLLDSTGAANFTDIKVIKKDTKEVLWDPIDSTELTTTLGGSTLISEATDSTGYTILSGDIEVEAGKDLNLSLTLDIANNSSLNGSTISAALNLDNTYPEMEDTETGTPLSNPTDLVPSTTIVSNIMTVKSASFNVSLASLPSNTVVRNEEDVNFVAYNFTCGETSDCELTDLKVQGYYDDEGNKDDFDTTYSSTDHTRSFSDMVSSLILVESDGSWVADPETINPFDYTAAFENFSLEIPAGTTKTLYVQGDVTIQAYNEGSGENIAFGIPSADWVTVEDEDGNVITATGSANTGPIVMMTTQPHGSLDVAVSPGTPSAGKVAGGSSNVLFSKYDFSASEEGFTIRNLSVNNSQYGVSAIDLAESDSYVKSISIVYPNEAGDTLKATGYLANGNVTFTGLDFYVPEDGTAELAIYADLNTVAKRTEVTHYVRLDLSFNAFSAEGKKSGAMVDLSLLDENMPSTFDLDLGPLFWRNGKSTFALDGAQTTSATLGEMVTLVIDDTSGDNSNKLPVGSMICVDDMRIGFCSGDVYLVEGWYSSTDDTEDSVRLVLIDDAGDGKYDDNDPLMYGLPGGVFLNGTYAQKITR